MSESPYAAPHREGASGSAALSRTAFNIGLVTVVVGPAWAVFSSRLGVDPFDAGLRAVQSWGGIVLTLAFGAAALVLGLLAIRHRGPRALAGIAIGIGAAEVLVTVVNTIDNLSLLTGTAS